MSVQEKAEEEVRGSKHSGLLFNPHSETFMGPLSGDAASSRCSGGLLHIRATLGVQPLGSRARPFPLRALHSDTFMILRGLGALAVMAPSTFQGLPKPLKENALLREGK